MQTSLSVNNCFETMLKVIQYFLLPPPPPPPPDLLSLGLADNCISNEGASSLAELIRQTDTLEKITLSGNDIYDEGGSMLMAALSQNTSLQGLYLAGVSIFYKIQETIRQIVSTTNFLQNHQNTPQ